MVDKVVLRLKALQSWHFYRFCQAATADVIFQYNFARSANLSDHPDFAPDRHKIVKEASINLHIDKQFGFFVLLLWLSAQIPMCFAYSWKYLRWANYVTRTTPAWVVKVLNPRVITLLEVEKGFNLPHTIRRC